MKQTWNVLPSGLTAWRAEHQIPSRVVDTKLPRIIRPIHQSGMTPAQRQELTALAERVNMPYGSFARKSKAMDDLCAWVEGYRKAKE